MKVLVVDDHPLIRQALSQVLVQLNRAVEVLEAADGAGALALADAHPDLHLILLDIALPGESGLALLPQLRARHPEFPVVVVSAADGCKVVEQAIAQGASGFIPKNLPNEVIVSALRLVLLGGIYLPPQVLRHHPGGAPAAPAPAPGPGPEALGLSARQLEVLRLLLLGKPNKLIARQLDITEATVKAHVTAVLRALKVMSRTEAVIQVGRLGWHFENRS